MDKVTAAQYIVEHSTIMLMSWEAPKHRASLKVDSFEDFMNNALTRLDVLALADSVIINNTKGLYGGKEENSCAIILTRPITTGELIGFLDALLKLGADLGQESILLRHNDENILLDCYTGKVLTNGFGFSLNPNSDYTILNGLKFSLSLNFEN